MGIILKGELIAVPKAGSVRGLVVGLRIAFPTGRDFVVGSREKGGCTIRGSPSRKKTEEDLDNERMASVLSFAHFPKSSPKSFPLFSKSWSASGVSCWLSWRRILRLLSTEMVAKAFPVKQRADSGLVLPCLLTLLFPTAAPSTDKSMAQLQIAVILIKIGHVIQCSFTSE